MNAIEQRVLQLIGENVSSPDVFKDNEDDIAPIRDSITDAIEEINMVTGGYVETFSIPLVEDQSLYRLSFNRGSFGWVQDAWLAGTKRRLTQTSVKSLSMEIPSWLQCSGTPERYFHVGHDVIGFFRKPASTSQVVEITAVVVPGPYESDGEQIKLRQSYHDAAVHYALAEYWAGRGDANEADRVMGYYLQSVGLIEKRQLAADRSYQSKTEKTA